ncbi:hypothetical protein V6257_06160 [Pseudoalteromonas issachenkonii]|uniref:Uncharacterized protein n=1 Tax=Pseudoalteromonas issachenkonii TaxID=152297 RepID=A0ABU9GYC6_9GAMM
MKLCRIIDNYTIFFERTIGDICHKVTGAKILGDIKIRSNCIVGENCVSVKDISVNSIVSGIPGKVIKSNINPKNYY